MSDSEQDGLGEPQADLGGTPVTAQPEALIDAMLDDVLEDPGGFAIDNTQALDSAVQILLTLRSWFRPVERAQVRTEWFRHYFKRNTGPGAAFDLLNESLRTGSPESRWSMIVSFYKEWVRRERIAADGDTVTREREKTMIVFDGDFQEAHVEWLTPWSGDDNWDDWLHKEGFDVNPVWQLGNEDQTPTDVRVWEHCSRDAWLVDFSHYRGRSRFFLFLIEGEVNYLRFVNSPLAHDLFAYDHREALVQVSQAAFQAWHGHAAPSTVEDRSEPRSSCNECSPEFGYQRRRKAAAYQKAREERRRAAEERKREGKA